MAARLYYFEFADDRPCEVMMEPIEHAEVRRR
jgi:hypothetical protein